jgi:hypothetical protein
MTRLMAERDDLECGRLASGVMVRPLLAAGLAFVDGARVESFHSRELSAWLKAWLVLPGLMAMPTTVSEPSVGTVALGSAISGAWAAGTDARLVRIVAAARARVTATLAGLVATPVDDRFVAAAIFSGRVQRSSGSNSGRARGSWLPKPAATDRLSDIVLSVFAADVLSNRDEYDASLCVCDVCGRVALDPTRLSSTLCEEHEAELG